MASKARTKVDEILFFPNGNTAVFDGLTLDAKPLPEFQKSWLRLYVEFLRSKGVDPEKVTFRLPGGRTARWRGNNWSVE